MTSPHHSGLVAFRRREDACIVQVYIARKGTNLSSKLNIITKPELSSADDGTRPTIRTGSGRPMVPVFSI